MHTQGKESLQKGNKKEREKSTNPFQSTPDMRKTAYPVRAPIVVNGPPMDQPPEKAKTLTPLSQLMTVEDEGKVIVYTISTS